MGSLSEIICGKIIDKNHPGEFTAGMTAASTSLLDHEKQLSRLWEIDSTNEFKRIAPACTRLILEQGLAIILGRLDPIRFVTIIKGSNSIDFKIGNKNSSSFNWTKDVLPDLKPGNSGYWSQETIGKSVHRAALDGHLADYLFNSCHTNLINDLTDETSTLAELPEWIIQLLRLEKGEHVLAAIRSKAQEAYSVLSKGVHFEFFLGRNTMPERGEIKDAITKSILVLSTTALYSHFSDISIQRLSRKKAIKCFLSLTNKYH